MAYTVINFKTKKALKEAVAYWHDYNKLDVDARVKMSKERGGIAQDIRAYQPRLGPDLSNYTGSVCIESPHYPAAHTWYAACQMKDGVIIKVK
jgi:hypothetical protein